MIPNTSTQSQDLFYACLGFPRPLSQIPGVYCRLEVKLGDKFFSFHTSSPSKRKSPSDYRRGQRRRKPSGKGMPTPGNHWVGSVAPGDPTGALKGIFSLDSSSPPCSWTKPWSRHLFSPTNIPLLKHLSNSSSQPRTCLLTTHINPRWEGWSWTRATIGTLIERSI